MRNLKIVENVKEQIILGFSRNLVTNQRNEELETKSQGDLIHWNRKKKKKESEERHKEG